MILAKALSASMTIVAASVNVLAASGEAPGLELDLRSRSHETEEITVTKERIDVSKLAIVVMDMWNYHWCKTCLFRAAALVPRMNRVFGIARELGIPIIFTPTDTVNSYSGAPQRERMAALPELDKQRYLTLKGKRKGKDRQRAKPDRRGFFRSKTDRIATVIADIDQARQDVFRRSRGSNPELARKLQALRKALKAVEVEIGKLDAE